MAEMVGEALVGDGTDLAEKVEKVLVGGVNDQRKNPSRKKSNRKKMKDRRSNENQTKIKQEENEIKSLESFLFGALYSRPEFGKEDGQGGGEPQAKEAPLFIVDKSASDEVVVYEEDLPLGKHRDQKRKPAWVDDEEEIIKVDIASVARLRKLKKVTGESVISGSECVSRLRAQHAKLNPFTEWARPSRDPASLLLDSDDDDSGITMAPGYEDDDNIGGAGDMLLSSEDLIISGGGGKLLPGLLEYSKLLDANSEEPSNAPINSVQFHRNGQLLLAAGLDRRLRLFQVDGKRNTKVQSIFLEDCPIQTASFLPDGSQIILSGRRKFFYSFDLVKAAILSIGPLTGREERSLEVFDVSPDSSTVAFVGEEGCILLVSPKTKALIGTLKMNGTARSLAFSGQQQLLSCGGDGEVYHWDLRTRSCIHRAPDEGCLTGTAIGASPDGRLFASGSSVGIVNVYNSGEFLGGKRKPAKVIENLTTQVDQVKFSPDGQVLAIASRMKKSSVRLVHVPSFQIFSNWPPPRMNMQYPRCLDFSPGGGFVAVGNAAGKVLLYKLHHYQKA